VGPDGLQQAGAHPGDPIQPVEAAEAPVRLTVRDDGLGESKPDARKPGQLGYWGNIGVDQLAGGEWPRLPPGTVPLGSRGVRLQRGEKLKLTGRFTGPGGKMPYALPCHRQREQQQERAALRWRHTVEGTAE
jgi:hypothetical protein